MSGSIFNNKKGYVHWYSELDGVRRPCVNGFRMMEFLDPVLAAEMLSNACGAARKYIRIFEPVYSNNGSEIELVLTVALRFLSGPYGEETGNDDRSLWGVMTDRKQKDCDDLTMIACAVFHAIKRAPDLPLEQYDDAVAYLKDTFTQAFFVQGQATPDVAHVGAGGHVFMILTRGNVVPVTVDSFRNGLLVECTTPMMPPGVKRSHPESDDTGTLVCSLKDYNLEKYVDVIALYTPRDTYFLKTGTAFGVPAKTLLGSPGPDVSVHKLPQFIIDSELIASGQTNFLYEHYDKDFVAQLRRLLKLGQEDGAKPASMGADYNGASWGFPPRTASKVVAFDVGGGAWCFFQSSDMSQSIHNYNVNKSTQA